MTSITSRPGRPLPLGVSLREGGAQFAVTSRHATRVHLLLFDEPRAAEPVASLPLDPATHRDGDVWSIEVEGVGPGQLYAYRAEGPFQPGRGLRFDPDLLLIDPYAHAICDGSVWDDPARLPGSVRPGLLTADERRRLWSAAAKAVVVDDRFDWGADRRPRTPLRDTVIYELHVRGFTAHPSSGVAHPGTYEGLIEKIPYLVELGVTAVELLPVHAFDPAENARRDPATGERLVNFWGYSPMAWFAPHGGYAAAGTRGEQVRSFKTLVRALHAAGIEVILDVVFNHTAEMDAQGPTLSLRGLDNPTYYVLGAGGSYVNHTGCGHTVHAHHPVVRDLIVDCLRHWAVEYHVDGFRFDLATTLTRDSAGETQAAPPLIERIEQDPVLRDRKLIAEAWDLGAVQVGRFPGQRWSEWNGVYRDEVRRYWRGDVGLLGRFATRLSGSADLYQGRGQTPHHGVAFVTCHDGFTLRDLVSYETKHNEANGEGNRDGAADEHSTNGGVEGPSDDPRVRLGRDRQVRNLLTTLLLSHGVPMLLAGDELGRTQRGNSNAWCHDGPLTWVDWERAERFADLTRFCRGLIALRRAHPSLRRPDFYEGSMDPELGADVAWSAPEGGEPAWTDPREHALGLQINGIEAGEPPLLLLCNAAPRARTFRLHDAPDGWTWGRLVDSARVPPEDLREIGDEAPLEDPTRYDLAPHAVVVLRGVEAER